MVESMILSPDPIVLNTNKTLNFDTLQFILWILLDLRVQRVQNFFQKRKLI